MINVNFKKKADAIKNINDSDVVASFGYDKYFVCPSHQDLLNIILESPNKCFFEYSSKNTPLTLFFDVDIKSTDQTFNNDIEFLNTLKQSVLDYFHNYVVQWIVLESHSITKKSYHIIVRLKDSNGNNVFFKNCTDLKKYVNDIITENTIDTVVYRDGLFRTIHSSKPNENRPFVKSELSDDFDDIDSFITYTPSPYIFYITEQEHIKNLKEILQTIEPSYNYNSWMHVGFSIIDYCNDENIDLDQGLALFHVYSKRNLQKYNKEHTIQQWNEWINREYDGPKITKGTILKMFKEKSEQRYNEMKLDNIDTNILKELDVISENSSVKIHDIKHFEVVTKTKATIKALMESSGLIPIHDYVSKNCKNCSLFSECDRTGYKICCRNCDFEYPPGNIPVDKTLAPTVFNLVIINKDDNIHNKDTSQVAKKMISYKHLIYTLDNKWYLYNENSGIYENKIDLEVMNEMEKVVEKMSQEGFEEEWFNWIHKVNYKENLLKELKIKCFKRVELDDNEFLLGFDNGVYDLKTGTLRKGLIHEYTTMKCGLPFNENVDTSLALEVLSGIFPDEIERDYALCKFALCLEGYNREQMITFAYGHTASNGKSYIMERMRQVLGEYSGTFPVTMLTGKMKGAGEANSSLIDFNKKRFMYCSEPEAGAKLNTNYVKLLTGDKIKARGLYAETDKEISPSYKINVCCNTLPNFDVYDEGIARRIRLIEYKTRFCDNPKKKNERKLKKYSKEEELEISQGLLKLLIEKYNLLRDNDYQYEEPKQFTSMRKLYLNDNKDVITDLIKENFEKGEEKDYVKMTDIKNVLKQGGIKEKDVITIQKLIEEMFDGVEFKENSYVNYKKVRNYFLGLRQK